MSRKSITGGITPAGPSRVQFDFVIDGVRFRPTLPWPATASNLERARKHLARIKAQIEAGTFCFAEVFPDYKGLTKVPATVRTRSCGEIFDDFLHHEERRVARGDLASVTLASHRQILDRIWRPHLGPLPFLGIQHSMLIKIADAHNWSKKTYNNAISALRRAFAFGYLDYPERRDPAASLKCSRIGKKDRPAIDPFSIQDTEVLIAALHRDWGQAQGNYDELRFFTGLRPSEEIALLVTDYDRQSGVLSVTKARVGGIDKDWPNHRARQTGRDSPARSASQGHLAISPRALLPPAAHRVSGAAAHRAISRSPIASLDPVQEPSGVKDRPTGPLPTPTIPVFCTNSIERRHERPLSRPLYRGVERIWPC
jgi:integrase